MLTSENEKTLSQQTDRNILSNNSPSETFGSNQIAPSQKQNLATKLGLAIRGLLPETTVALPSRGWVVVMLLACLIAIGVSGYLAWVAITSSKVAGCGGGRLFNCGHVISSRWSLWFGIPVSLLAVGLYTSMALALLVGTMFNVHETHRLAAWSFVCTLAVSAGMAAIWFISLQVIAVQHLCSYCLVAHGCGLVVSGIVLWKKPVGGKVVKKLSALSLAGVGILVTGQLLATPPETFRIETFEPPAVEPENVTSPSDTDPDTDNLFEAPVIDDVSLERPVKDLPEIALAQSSLVFLYPQLAFALPVLVLELQQDQNAESKTKPAGEKGKPDRRLVSINGGSIKLDIAQWPLVGSQTAKYVFVEMYDYACPHCRKTHATVKAATKQLSADMAVVALPVPLNTNCNDAIQVTGPRFTDSCELANLAIAVWRVDPAQFTEFHNWMFTGEQAPTFANARSQAERMVDAEKLATVLKSPVPGKYIAKNVELYKRAGGGNVPKLMFPGTSIVGEFTSVDALVDIVRREIK